MMFKPFSLIYLFIFTFFDMLTWVFVPLLCRWPPAVPVVFLGWDPQFQTKSQPVSWTFLLNGACIKFKSLMLTYGALAGSAPSYLNDLVRPHVTPRPLCSAHLAKPSVRAQQSRLFSYRVPLWWNGLLRSVRARMTHSSFKKLLKIKHLP